jgi:hypothetical protein
MGEVDVSHFDVDSIQRLVDFLYKQDYDVGKPRTPGRLASRSKQGITNTEDAFRKFLIHVKMNEIGDYYDIQELVLKSTARATHDLKDCNINKDKSLKAIRAVFAEPHTKALEESIAKVITFSILEKSLKVDWDTVVEYPTFTKCFITMSVSLYDQANTKIERYKTTHFYLNENSHCSNPLCSGIFDCQIHETGTDVEVVCNVCHDYIKG